MRPIRGALPMTTNACLFIYFLPLLCLFLFFSFVFPGGAFEWGFFSPLHRPLPLLLFIEKNIQPFFFYCLHGITIIVTTTTTIIIIPPQGRLPTLALRLSLSLSLRLHIYYM